MIVMENMDINGKEFIKTYSDAGCMIEREGIRYEEAIDPAEFNRKYTETDEPIEGYTDEATAEDYQAALGGFGVKV